MDVMTGLPILTTWKGDSNNLILVIFDQLIKMVYYKLVKVIIDTLGQTKMIINMILCHHRVPELNVINWDLLFMSKFRSLLYYFLGIKKKAIHSFPPINKSPDKEVEQNDRDVPQSIY